MPGRGQAVAQGQPKQVISIIIPGYLGGVRNDCVSNWLRIHRAFILDAAVVRITAKVAYAGTGPEFRIMRSVDNGAAWNSIGSFTASTGLNYQELSPIWLYSQLDAGNLLRFDIIVTDNGTGSGSQFDVIEGH